MTLPEEHEWIRVEELASALARLSPEEAHQRMAEFQAQGEPLSILSLVSSWLSLPLLRAPLNPGDLVAGRYTLRSKLGEGGMGSVWRATQSMIERDVAVKLIHPALVTPALRERFAREMEIMGQLEHPGIVRIFDAGLSQHDGETIPFFAMELIEGQSLSQWAAAHRQDRGALLRMMSEICAAVQHAHDRKIVHRDLKPANILIEKNGRPVVLDFGLARLTAATGDEQNGVFSGTPHYAAPEQHLGCDRDFRSGESVDVYAAGAILFEILSGRRLFEFPQGTSIGEMRRKIVEGVPPRLNEVISECPLAVDEIVARAVRRSPADRYYSIASLARALTSAATRLYGPPRQPLPPWVPAAGLSVPETNWKLETKLGEGSTGEVWLAVHQGLNERRVFKFCDSEEKVRTLKRELTLFRLLKERVGQNPHFIALHEVSLEDPPWYLMMDHVEAQDLESWCASRPGGIEGLPLERKVEIIAQAAEALQSAHEAGILHRDIKPDNILIGRADGSTDPHVLIADFGIGQLVADELLREGAAASFTFTLNDLRRSTFSGTMLYLAPEVLEGGAATARSDIYSLGVVLWQLLVGNLHAALDPVNWPARIADPLLREDLTRCLAGNPDSRWSSAGALSTSLRSLAQRRRAEELRLAKLVAAERTAYRRGVLRAALVAVAVMTMLAGLGWYAWTKSVEAEKQRKAATAARAGVALGELRRLNALQSGEARRKLFRELPSLELENAVLKGAFRDAAVAILAQHSFEPIEPTPLTLEDADRIAELGDRIIRLNPATHLPEVLDLGIPSTFRRPLVPAEQNMARLSLNARGRVAGAVAANGTLYLWHGVDSFTGRPAGHRLIAGPIHAGTYAITPTTLSRSAMTAVAVARPDGAVDLLFAEKPDVPAARLFRRSSPTEDAFPESSPATMLEFCTEPEGVLAVAGPESNLVSFWTTGDSDRKQIVAELAGCAWHPDTIRCIRWSPRGPEIATGAEDGVLRIWRYAVRINPQKDPLRSLDLGEPIRDLIWSPDGSLLVVLLDSGNIRVLSAQTPNMPLVDALSLPGASRVGFVGGNRIVAWSREKCAVWETPGACFTQRIISSRDIAVAYHRHGTLTVSSLEGITFLLPETLAWSGGFKASSRLPAAWIADQLIYQDGTSWKYAQTSELNSPRRMRLDMGASPPPSGVYVSSPSGRRMAFFDGERIRSLRSDRSEEGQPAVSTHAPLHLAVSDHAPLSAWIEDDQLRVFWHDTGENWAEPTTKILGLCFSPAGNLLACRTEQGVDFVHPQTRQKITSPVRAPSAGPSPLAFSGDGRWLAVCGSNHEILLGQMPSASSCWASDGAMLKAVFSDALILQSPSPKRITSLSWNSTGSRLAGGTADGFVQSWNLSLLRRTLRLWGLETSHDPIPPDPEVIPITLK